LSKRKYAYARSERLIQNQEHLFGYEYSWLEPRCYTLLYRQHEKLASPEHDCEHVRSEFFIPDENGDSCWLRLRAEIERDGPEGKTLADKLQQEIFDLLDKSTPPFPSDRKMMVLRKLLGKPGLEFLKASRAAYLRQLQALVEDDDAYDKRNEKAYQVFYHPKNLWVVQLLMCGATLINVAWVLELHLHEGDYRTRGLQGLALEETEDVKIQRLYCWRSGAAVSLLLLNIATIKVLLHSYTVLIHCTHTLYSYTVLLHCTHILSLQSSPRAGSFVT
jgi:hypothetical protein